MVRGKTILYIAIALVIAFILLSSFTTVWEARADGINVAVIDENGNTVRFVKNRYGVYVPSSSILAININPVKIKGFIINGEATGTVYGSADGIRMEIAVFFEVYKSVNGRMGKKLYTWLTSHAVSMSTSGSSGGCRYPKNDPYLYGSYTRINDTIRFRIRVDGYYVPIYNVIREKARENLPVIVKIYYEVKVWKLENIYGTAYFRILHDTYTMKRSDPIMILVENPVSTGGELLVNETITITP